MMMKIKMLIRNKFCSFSLRPLLEFEFEFDSNIIDVRFHRDK
jgi:hypothetical protein